MLSTFLSYPITAADLVFQFYKCRAEDTFVRTLGHTFVSLWSAVEEWGFTNTVCCLFVLFILSDFFVIMDLGFCNLSFP